MPRKETKLLKEIKLFIGEATHVLDYTPKDETHLQVSFLKGLLKVNEYVDGYGLEKFLGWLYDQDSIASGLKDSIALYLDLSHRVDRLNAGSKDKYIKN